MDYSGAINYLLLGYFALFAHIKKNYGIDEEKKKKKKKKKKYCKVGSSRSIDGHVHTELAIFAIVRDA